MLYNHIKNMLSVSLNKTFPSFLILTSVRLIKTRTFKTIDRWNLVMAISNADEKCCCKIDLYRKSSQHWQVTFFGSKQKQILGERERNVLFNNTLNTFYLRLYGIRHMVKDHCDSEKGNPLLPHRLLLSISSKGSFICTIPQTG